MSSILEQVAADAVAANDERWERHNQQVAMLRDEEPSYEEGVEEGRAIARRVKVKWALFGWALGTGGALAGQAVWFLTR